MEPGRLAVITGSGVAIDDVAPDGEDRTVPCGDADIVIRDGGRLLVVGRHGPRRSNPAHRVDHVANLTALRDLGCDRVLAIASTGSLRRDWPVGTVVAPDDFFGPWVTGSLFDDMRGHSVPGFDVAWRHTVLDAWRAATDTPIVDGGVYVQTIGPRFETPAEIRFLATVGDVVGMTIAAECIVAKEADLAYATVCVVDNMANGLEDVGLTREEFEAGVARNRTRLVDDVGRTVGQLSGEV